MTNQPKGFTLIELLIVIGIVVILSVAVVITLNPAQLLAQARDSTRIQDLATLKSAIALYLADASSISMGSQTFCYVHASSSIGAGSGCSSRFSGGTNNLSSSIAVDGGGWVPVPFSTISSGAPISALPIDPVNDSTYFYAYQPSSTARTFELNANMESTRYAQGGNGDVESTDGGNAAALYEVGTDPGLDM